MVGAAIKLYSHSRLFYWVVFLYIKKEQTKEHRYEDDEHACQ